MFTIDLEFKNFLGETKTETLRFNMTKDQMMELATKDPVFDSDYLSSVSRDQDGQAMYDIVRKLVIASFGVLSDDGNFFRKPKEATEAFKESAMFETMLEKLFNPNDDTFLTAFLTDVFPTEIAEAVARNAKPLEVVK